MKHLQKKDEEVFTYVEKGILSHLFVTHSILIKIDYFSLHQSSICHANQIRKGHFLLRICAFVIIESSLNVSIS